MLPDRKAWYGRCLARQWRPSGSQSFGPGCKNSGYGAGVLGPPGEGQDPDVGGGQRKRDPDVGALRSPDPGRTTPVSVQPRTPDRGCAERRGRGSLTIRGSWRQRRPARSLPVGSAPPPVPRWWPLRPRGPARGAQAQRRPTGASPRCFSELVVSVHGHTRAHTHTDLYPQSLSRSLSLTDTRTCSILTLTHTHTLTYPPAAQA